MQSGSAFESLDMDVGCFSVAPCVQKPAASANTIKACSTLHEAAVTVALRGPLTKMLTIMREGFALVVRYFVCPLAIAGDDHILSLARYRGKLSWVAQWLVLSVLQSSRRQHSLSCLIFSRSGMIPIRR